MPAGLVASRGGGVIGMGVEGEVACSEEDAALLGGRGGGGIGHQ